MPEKPLSSYDPNSPSYSPVPYGGEFTPHGGIPADVPRYAYDPSYTPKIQKPLTPEQRSAALSNIVANPASAIKTPVTMSVPTPRPKASVPVGMTKSPAALFGGGIENPATASLAGVAQQLEKQTTSSPMVQTAAPQVQGGGGDINSMMNQLYQPLDPNMLLTGMIPTAAGHAMEMPLSMTQPLPAFQPTPFMPHGVGRKYNKEVGIANAVTGVSNVIGQFSRQKEQQHHEQVATATSRLIQAQHTIDQAQQYLNQPGITPQQSALLQKRIDDSKNLMNQILSDDKMRKDIGKGMDVSFTDPSQNRTPEHGAVAAGKQQVTDSFQQQFEKQMPSAIGPDPMAQQKLQMYITQNQAYQKMMSSMIPRMLSAQSAMERAHYIQGMANTRQMQNHIFEAWKLGQQFDNDKQKLAINNRYKLGQISAQIQQMGQKSMELFQAEKLDPTTLFTEKTNFAKQAAGVESSLGEQQQKAVKDMQDANLILSNPKITDATQRAGAQENYDNAKNVLNRVNQQIKNFQDFKNTWYGNMTIMENMGSGNVGMIGGGVNAGAGSAGTTGATPATSGYGQTFDPATLLYGLQFQSGGAGILPTTDGSDNAEGTE